MAEGIPLEDFDRDTTHPYDDINNVNDLQLILDSSKYEDAWSADMKERMSALKGKKELEKFKVELTDQNYNKLKQLFENKFPNADRINIDVLNLPELNNKKIKTVLRERILKKSDDLYLRTTGPNVNQIDFGKHKYKAIKITQNNGKDFIALSTLQKYGMSVKDPFYKLLNNEYKNMETSFTDNIIESAETLRKTVAFAHEDIASTSTPIVPKQRSVIEEIPRQLESKELNTVLTTEDRNRIVSYLDFVQKNYNKKIQLINDIEFNKKQIDKAEKQLLTETDPDKIDILKKFITDSEANIQSSKQMLDQILAYNERQYEDINMRLKSKFTLKEKILNIFKKYGLTITAITLALGLIIDTIVTSVRGSPTNIPSGGSNNNITGKIKQSLKNFSNWLLEMSKKALDNLPSIIGTIISFLLKTTASIVGFLAEHIILFVIALAFALYEALKIGYTDFNRRKNK